MINATKAEQATLLELGKLDLELTKSNSALVALERNSEVDGLRGQLLEASDQLLQAHAKQENLQTELKKIASDVELVEARISQDQAKVLQVTSEREQKAVTQELASLAARKSNLEDSELETLEALEVAEQEVKQLTQARATLNLELEKAMAKQHGEVLNLSAAVAELQAKREQTFAKLSAQLQELYTRKSSRGIAVAQTLGRDCSACRLAINAIEFEAIMAQPEDQLPTCPNCDAFIIR